MARTGKPTHAEAHDPVGHGHGHTVPPLPCGPQRRRCGRDDAGNPTRLFGRGHAAAQLRPYRTRSHVCTWRGGPGVRETYIGGDLEPRAALCHVVTESGIRHFMGATRDGVGVDRLANCAADLGAVNVRPFRTQPRLYRDSDFPMARHAGIASVLADSIRILKDTLTPEFQIVAAGTRFSYVAASGEITVDPEPRASIAAACRSTAAVIGARPLLSTGPRRRAPASGSRPGRAASAGTRRRGNGGRRRAAASRDASTATKSSTG